MERHTAEAASLLVMDKERILEEGDNLRALFSHLNGHQIIHLLEKIHVDEVPYLLARARCVACAVRVRLMSHVTNSRPRV